MVCLHPQIPHQDSWNLTNASPRPFFTICFIVSSCSAEHRAEKQFQIANVYLAAAIDSPCYAQVQGKYDSINHVLTPLLTYYIGGPMLHMPLYTRPTVGSALEIIRYHLIGKLDNNTNNDYISDRPDITPETRPPAGMQYGIQPPPQAQGGWQQQPPLQPPPQAQGGLGYK